MNPLPATRKSKPSLSISSTCGRASARSRTSSASATAASAGRLGVAVAGDVEQVMDRVVDEVPGERLDREVGAVAAVTGALPLLRREGVEPGRERLGRHRNLGRHRGGILLTVAL